MRDRSRGIVSTDGHYRATTRTPVSFSVPQHRPQRGGLWLVGSSKSEKFILNPIPRAKLQRHLHVQPPSPNGVMARKERRGEEPTIQFSSALARLKPRFPMCEARNAYHSLAQAQQARSTHTSSRALRRRRCCECVQPTAFLTWQRESGRKRTNGE